jgi:sirohydrochlorin ferrochelatase
MRDLVILVAHGQLPKDIPLELKSRYFRLRSKDRNEEEEKDFEELEKRIYEWPRNEKNDPYWYSIKILAEELRKKLNFIEVYFSFLEFCKPSFKEVLEKACSEEYERIFVVPTMFLPGGVHSEEEIPEYIEEIKKKYNKEIIYVWPFKIEDIANLISNYIKKFELG